MPWQASRCSTMWSLAGGGASRRRAAARTGPGTLLLYKVELDPVQYGAVVDRPGVRGPPAQRLQVRLARPPDIVRGDSPERHQLDRVHLDGRGPDRIPSADPYLRPLPQPE